MRGTYRQSKHTSKALKQWYKLLGTEFESFLTKFSAAYQCFFTSSPFEILSVQNDKIRKILSCLAKKLGSCFITCFRTPLDPLTHRHIDFIKIFETTSIAEQDLKLPL